MRNLNIALFLRQALKPVEPINIVFGPLVLMTVNQHIRLDRKDFAGGKPEPSSHYGLGDV